LRNTTLRAGPAPSTTNALTCENRAWAMTSLCVNVIRDEEVVGSNPATPTVKVQVNGLLAGHGKQAADRLTLV